MILYAGLYVLNFIMIIPLVLLGADYWEDGLEEGKPRGRVILIRYIQIVIPGTVFVWALGQIVALFSLGGGIQDAQVFIGTVLAIVSILLASVVYAVLLEKRRVARG